MAKRQTVKNMSKAVAGLTFIILAVCLFAAKGTKSSDNEDKSWTNADFSFSVVSLFFASCLLYGAISGFRLFVIMWMIWNVLLVAFWAVYIIWRYDQDMLLWQKIFRLASIIFMTFSEVPVLIYCMKLTEKVEDPETAEPTQVIIEPRSTLNRVKSTTIQMTLDREQLQEISTSEQNKSEVTNIVQYDNLGADFDEIDLTKQTNTTPEIQDVQVDNTDNKTSQINSESVIQADEQFENIPSEATTKF